MYPRFIFKHSTFKLQCYSQGLWKHIFFAVTKFTQLIEVAYKTHAQWLLADLEIGKPLTKFKDYLCVLVDCTV